MKQFTVSLLLFFILTCVACRDTKKEEAELNATLEKVDSIEASMDTISMDIDAKTEDLENALEELDSI